jgi:hypothetical protein
MGEAEREYLKIWLSHAVIGAAATVAVGLRFWARNRTGAKLKLDDHLIVLTALLMWGDFICTILGNLSILLFGMKGTSSNNILLTDYRISSVSQQGPS